jgi:hypothetical protein
VNAYAAGYPIASGVAEGACKHLVKDRMERAGMRWELEGAHAMLSLRAVYLNGLWDPFITYRITTEQTRLYGRCMSIVAGACAQREAVAARR